MNLRSRNKVKADFNMSSLTDIIFLLLIFFMLTSTLVSPNALKLLLPNSNSQTLAKTSVSVSITKDLEFFVGKDQVTESELKSVIASRIQGEVDPTVVVNADKSVPIDHVVQVMNVGNELNVKINNEKKVLLLMFMFNQNLN
jgi:biopolymer transport protein ExbD